MKIYKFKAVSDSGRTVEAIVSAREWEINWLIGKEVNFGDEGEDVKVVIEPDDFSVLTEDSAEVSTIARVIDSFGNDPFDHLTDAQLAEYDDASSQEARTLQALKTEQARENLTTALHETFNR